MTRRAISEFRQARVCDCGEHGFVGLPLGQVTLFSAGRLAEVSASRWTVLHGDGRLYVRRSRGDRRLLHRALTNPARNELVDHRNRDGLDNRDENLRVCNNNDNSRNQGKFRGASKFKGVHLGPRRSGWVVGLGIEGRTKYIGYFHDQIEAARAYDAAAIEHFGEFALTNAMLGLLPATAE